MKPRGICAVCARPERGFGFDPRLAKRQGKARWFCSRKCQVRFYGARDMVDWTKEEDEMLLEAGKAGGEYLTELGITDMARLSKPQWIMFLRCIFGRHAEVWPDWYRALYAQLIEEDKVNGVPFA